jgi:hypothetical protein
VLTFDKVKIFGSVLGAKAMAVTRAPIETSHCASQAPLKPVCPVKSTRLPDQKAAFGSVVDGAGFIPGFVTRLFKALCLFRKISRKLF